MDALYLGYRSTHLSATPVAHWPSSYLRSSSFLCHICTTLSTMGKWLSSPHAMPRGVGSRGSPAWTSLMTFLLFLSHAASPSLAQERWLQALLCLRFPASSLFWASAQGVWAKGFPGNNHPLLFSPPQAICLPQSRLYNWEKLTLAN